MVKNWKKKKSLSPWSTNHLSSLSFAPPPSPACPLSLSIELYRVSCFHGNERTELSNRLCVTQFLSSGSFSVLPSAESCLTFPGLRCCECKCGWWLTWISEGIVKHYREVQVHRLWEMGWKAPRCQCSSCHNVSSAIRGPGQSGGLQLSVRSNLMSQKEQRKTFVVLLQLLSSVGTFDVNRFRRAAVLLWKVKLLLVFFKFPFFSRPSLGRAKFFCSTQPARSARYYPPCNLHIRKSVPAAMKGKWFIIHGLVNVGAIG